MQRFDRNFDRNNVQALLAEVVRKRGENYRYGVDTGESGCFYERKGEPSCGIGLMLSDIGVTIPVLKSIDRCGETNIDAWSVQVHLENAGFTFTKGAIKFMRAFQAWQDQGYVYSVCMEKAKGGHMDPFSLSAGAPPF